MAERISRFKKFTDMKRSENNNEIHLDGSNHVPPMNPNTPNKNKRVEVTASKKSITTSKEQEKQVALNNDDNIEKLSDIKKKDVKIDEQVQTYGKVAKFPKNVKASNAYKFLENVKISKKSIWYIIVEKQNNELQMVKYNYKEGVDLNQFVNELKSYYLSHYSKDVSLCEAINNIYVDGNDKYSMIKNIPLIKVDGKNMITKLTEDLIKLLSR